MAKKATYTFTAELSLNLEKAGAWIAKVTVMTEDNVVESSITEAWKNASAAKRWVKAKVQEMTPRKSVKLVPNEDKDAKGKPAYFYGELTFKA